jgi:hypothetical protein
MVKAYISCTQPYFCGEGRQAARARRGQRLVRLLRWAGLAPHTPAADRPAAGWAGQPGGEEKAGKRQRQAWPLTPDASLSVNTAMDMFIQMGIT